MSIKFVQLLVMIIIAIINSEPVTCQPGTNDLQQGFTTRCDELCSNEIQEDLKPDCQRGCQYYNIEFLVSASNKNKVTDLETTNNKCRLSCLEAYSLRLKSQNSCDIGCGKMNDLQSKAPYINGWLVYMGAPDHSMVLLQPDLDISSDDDDWVLLDSVMRNNNDYDKIFEQYKLTETRIQTIPAHDCRRRFSLDFSWLWIFPVVALMFATIRLVQRNFTENIHFRYDVNNWNEQCGDKFLTDATGKPICPNDHFVVTNDAYFYPSPVIPTPPPQYTESAEAMLLSDDDDCNARNEFKSSVQK